MCKIAVMLFLFHKLTGTDSLNVSHYNPTQLNLSPIN